MTPQTEKKYRESAILKRIADNDIIAAKELIDSYGNFIYSLAKKFTRTHEDAEDAVQEIFLEIWRHAGRFDPEKSSEIGFVALIAKRKLIDNYRRTKSRPVFETSEKVLDELTVQSDRQMEIRIDLQKALKTLSKLQPEHKSLILMSAYEGLSHADIAALIGRPLGTIKSGIRRGLKTVRQDLNFETV